MHVIYDDLQFMLFYNNNVIVETVKDQQTLNEYHSEFHSYQYFDSHEKKYFIYRKAYTIIKLYLKYEVKIEFYF